MTNFKNVLIVLLLGLTPATNVFSAKQDNAEHTENSNPNHDEQQSQQGQKHQHANNHPEKRAELSSSDEKDCDGHEVKEQTEPCAICADEDSDESLFVLHKTDNGNNHSFHKSCIIEHLFRKLDCPLCRMPVELNKLGFTHDETKTINANLTVNDKARREEITQADRTMQLELQILNAAQTGNIPLLIQALDQGANINARDAIGNTPLLIATIAGNFELISALILRQNIDINATNNVKQTALHIACLRGDLDIVELLLSCEEDIALDPQDCIGNTPFLSATSMGHHEVMEILRDEGANINVTTSLQLNGKVFHNNTALHIATINGYVASVEVLTSPATIAAGFNLNARNSLGHAALTIAIAKGLIEIQQMLTSAGATE